MSIKPEDVNLILVMGCQDREWGTLPPADVYKPFSPVLERMDDGGYCDYINDEWYFIDDFGHAIRGRWDLHFFNGWSH